MNLRLSELYARFNAGRCPYCGSEMEIGAELIHERICDSCVNKRVKPISTLSFADLIAFILRSTLTTNHEHIANHVMMLRPTTFTNSAMCHMVYMKLDTMHREGRVKKIGDDAWQLNETEGIK